MEIVITKQVTTRHTIPDVIEEKLNAYIKTHEDELKQAGCYKYREQLEQAYIAVCGNPEDYTPSLVDWNIVTYTG